MTVDRRMDAVVEHCWMLDEQKVIAGRRLDPGTMSSEREEAGFVADSVQTMDLQQIDSWNNRTQIHCSSYTGYTTTTRLDKLQLHQLDLQSHTLQIDPCSLSSLA